MRVFLLWVCILSLGLAISCSSAENPSDPEEEEFRFLDPVFPAISVIAQQKYGDNITVAGRWQELYFDFYAPRGDDFEVRPLLILASGGSFIERDDNMEPLAETLARYGYTVAIVDYRLYDKTAEAQGLDFIRAILHARSDMLAAIRFFVRDARKSNQYRIDTNSIFMGGYSAGAIAALHTAYVKDEVDLELNEDFRTLIELEGGLSGDTNPDDTPTPIRGIVNFSGALLSADFIQAGDPPLYSMHGTADSIIPFGPGKMHIGQDEIFMSGSAVLHQRTEQLGIANIFIPLEEGDHYSPLKQGADCSECLEALIVFLLEEIF